MFTATISGRMGKDPENKGSDGKEMTAFTVAVSQRRKVGDTWQDVTTWVNCIAFGREAGTVARFGRKGAVVIATGEIEVGVWTPSNGEARPDVRMRVASVDVPRMDGGGEAAERREAPARTPSRGGGYAGGGGGYPGGGDDIPFATAEIPDPLGWVR